MEFVAAQVLSVPSVVPFPGWPCLPLCHCTAADAASSVYRSLTAFDGLSP